MSTDAVFPESFPRWVAAQRWYADKGSLPRLERIGGWSVVRDDVNVSTHYLLDHSASEPSLYQIPLTTRAEPLPAAKPIGTQAPTPDGTDQRFVYDATVDPVYAEMLLEMILSEASVGEDTANPVVGHRQPGAAAVRVTAAHVLRGEQSNTSIICDVDSGPPVIIKVFRALHHGDNPDVTLQSAIAAAGSTLVPTSIGYLTGTWSDTGRVSGRATGHLAFVQEFLPGVEDAWRVALHAADINEDFTERARALGVATAEVHALLAQSLPTRPATESDITSALTSMRARLATAEAEVPSLVDLHESIESIFESARSAPWPALQRIHGDYHLGQVLWVEGRGWVLLDFEGEPLRPMAERSELDFPLRDVAGMLRSFDYVAGSVAQTARANAITGTVPHHGLSDAASVVAWASAARHAFMDGYIDHSGIDVRLHRALLDAFEIDKALYEAFYEARNRPSWVEIPESAIRRLAERGHVGTRRGAGYV